MYAGVAKEALDRFVHSDDGVVFDYSCVQFHEDHHWRYGDVIGQSTEQGYIFMCMCCIVYI